MTTIKSLQLAVKKALADGHVTAAEGQKLAKLAAGGGANGVTRKAVLAAAVDRYDAKFDAGARAVIDPVLKPARDAAAPVFRDAYWTTTDYSKYEDKALADGTIDPAEAKVLSMLSNRATAELGELVLATWSLNKARFAPGATGPALEELKALSDGKVSLAEMKTINTALVGDAADRRTGDAGHTLLAAFYGEHWRQLEPDARAFVQKELRIPADRISVLVTNSLTDTVLENALRKVAGDNSLSPTDVKALIEAVRSDSPTPQVSPDVRNRLVALANRFADRMTGNARSILQTFLQSAQDGLEPVGLTQVVHARLGNRGLLAPLPTDTIGLPRAVAMARELGTAEFGVLELPTNVRLNIAGLVVLDPASAVGRTPYSIPLTLTRGSTSGTFRVTGDYNLGFNDNANAYQRFHIDLNNITPEQLAGGSTLNLPIAFQRSAFVNGASTWIPD